MWNRPKRGSIHVRSRPQDEVRPANPFVDAVIAALPGLGLTGVIAAGAFALRQIPGVGLFSPMILATIIGMVIP